MPEGLNTKISSPTVGMNELQRMMPAHHRIVDLALQGYTNRQIAEQMNRTPEGIGLVLKSPLVQGELSRRREIQNQAQATGSANTLNRAKEILIEAAVPAANTLVSLLDAQDDSIKRQSANDIFKMIYGTEGTKAPSATVINIEQMNVLIQALKEDRIVHSE